MSRSLTTKRETVMVEKIGRTLRRYVRDMNLTDAAKRKILSVARATTYKWYSHHLHGISLTKEQKDKIERGIKQMNSFVFDRFNVSIKKMLLLVYGIALIITFLYFSYQYDRACSLPESRIEGAVTALYRGGQRLMGSVPSCEKNQAFYKSMMNTIEGLGASSFAVAVLKWIAKYGEQYALGGKKEEIHLEWIPGKRGSRIEGNIKLTAPTID